MTSGAVHRGLVVLDTMITDAEWPSMLRADREVGEGTG